MRGSKLAFFRYKLIDRMIRDKQKPYPTKDELLEACEHEFGVKSISTIEKDLQSMRLEFDAPIAYHKKMKGYYYEDSSFQFGGVNLNEDHLMALEFVESILNEFKSFPFINEFSDAIEKVLDGVTISRNFAADGSNATKKIMTEKSAYVKPNKWLNILTKGITSKKVFSIGYQKFGASDSSVYTLHPFMIREYKDRWYVVGYISEKDDVRIFGIDRITDCQEVETDFSYAQESKFDPIEFFKYTYGITALSEEPKDVVLSFTPYSGNFVKSAPIHSSQETILDDDNETRIKLKVVVNYELKNWIMGFGSSVKVLEPITLKEEIKEEIEKMLRNYSSN
ncbi:helix-turn-helix transcriptional regulator [Sediminitomix flava]|uniref:Putative DNA-binding transcriptional regulator YafY n=1 Tax=Sediminitomix flava TaxID=379075 RepID=A0A315Z907_SEDFL|nr:WYL domain-containing protein [Sediminitomix flava]PWJ42045.1 putative DNA-binding transcriptional regulator YafY [Sediminitomix flava]